MRHLWCCALVVGLVWSTHTDVQASTIKLWINSSYGSAENTGATARLQLSFSELGATDLLHVLIENTTPVSIGSSLTAVGLEIPNSSATSFATGGAGSYFDEVDLDESISPGWLSATGGYDVMLTGDGNFEGGSPQSAPTSGQSDSVILDLGDTGMTSVELFDAFDDFYENHTGMVAIGRFQAVGPDGEDSDKVGGHTPEPGTLTLLMVGGLLAARRR
ncbi:MAG: PEP-CTERM sorting domain-containing protein [bacterium]|nr:PEP-CTERM sorting domain-containing protein [bacterium]